MFILLICLLYINEETGRVVISNWCLLMTGSPVFCVFTNFVPFSLGASYCKALAILGRISVQVQAWALFSMMVPRKVITL